jgi:mRNA interferase MazF
VSGSSVRVGVGTGDILLVDLDPTAGREQGGYRPVVVVSDRRYAMIPGLFLGIPFTTTDRRLPHHVPVPATGDTGLIRVSFAMTEQIRVLSHDRVDRVLGRVGEPEFSEISRYVHMFIA